MFGCRFPQTRATGVMLALAIGLTAPAAARAYTVAVEPPDRKDPALVESFSRLCGELSMYGLDVQQVETAGADAIGGVALVRSGAQLSARIWIAAPTENDKIVRITITVPDADAPSLLAIRAADLLRASLRDYRGLVLPGPAAATTAVPTPPPPPAAPAEVAASPPVAIIGGRASAWTAAASASMLLDPAKLGMGLAPSVEISRRFGERLFILVDVIGPVMGHGLASSAGMAHVREALATVALAARLAEGTRAALDLSVAVGPAYLAVHGDALPPWTAESSSAWAAVFGAGVRLTFRLTSRLALSAATAAMFIVPGPVVDLGPDSYALGQPLILSSLGLNVDFF